MADGAGREPTGPDAIVTPRIRCCFGPGAVSDPDEAAIDRSEVTRIDGKPAPGYWANRPRDVANLTRFASRELERG